MKIITTKKNRYGIKNFRLGGFEVDGKFYENPYRHNWDGEGYELYVSKGENTIPECDEKMKYEHWIWSVNTHLGKGDMGENKNYDDTNIKIFEYLGKEDVFHNDKPNEVIQRNIEVKEGVHFVYRMDMN